MAFKRDFIFDVVGLVSVIFLVPILRKLAEVIGCDGFIALLDKQVITIYNGPSQFLPIQIKHNLIHNHTLAILYSSETLDSSNVVTV